MALSVNFIFTAEFPSGPKADSSYYPLSRLYSVLFPSRLTEKQAEIRLIPHNLTYSGYWHIIQRNMRRIVKGRTVIIIAHRLAAVRGCDRIVGMADGRIVEVGAHAELVRRPGGLYAYLWSLQSQPTEIAA